MCTPVLAMTTLTIAQAGLQMAASVAQSNSIRAQGEAQNKYYNYLADVNEQQAILSQRTGDAQSKVIQDVQQVEGKKMEISQAELRASQHAAMAASGISLSDVTAQDIDHTTFTKQAMDENLLRYNADVRSWEAKTGARQQAWGLRSQAAGYRASGANALTAAKYSAKNTLLSGALSSAGTLSSFIFKPFSTGGFAIPGVGGYGLNTPIGTYNTGTMSILRR